MKVTQILDDRGYSALYVDGQLVSVDTDQEDLDQDLIDRLLSRLRKYEPATTFDMYYPSDELPVKDRASYPPLLNDLSLKGYTQDEWEIADELPEEE